MPNWEVFDGAVRHRFGRRWRKGLAHVLMLEAIDEMGLRPICVAGTSIGAAIGVLYCSGKSGREIRESIMRMAPLDDTSFPDVQTNKHPFKWLEFIAPQFDGTGLFKAERFVSWLFESIQATSFDQLVIPLRVVAADFWSREEVILDEGLLRPAVQASMSLPGLFSPVVLGGRVLVDGGAVNPVPFDVLPPDCTVAAAVDVIGQRGHMGAEPPSLSEAIFNTFQIMEKSIVRAKLRARRRTFISKSSPSMFACWNSIKPSRSLLRRRRPKTGSSAKWKGTSLRLG